MSDARKEFLDQIKQAAEKYCPQEIDALNAVNIMLSVAVHMYIQHNEQKAVSMGKLIGIMTELTANHCSRYIEEEK